MKNTEGRGRRDAEGRIKVCKWKGGENKGGETKVEGKQRWGEKEDKGRQVWRENRKENRDE